MKTVKLDMVHFTVFYFSGLILSLTANFCQSYFINDLQLSWNTADSPCRRMTTAQMMEASRDGT